MPFQMRDETAGIDILYIDNSGNAGLGSIPNGGQYLTVQGQNFISTSAQLGDGVLVPGSQAGYEGVVSIPANSTANIAISASQSPTVTTTAATAAISPTQVTLSNQGGATVTAPYAIF